MPKTTSYQLILDLGSAWPLGICTSELGKLIQT